MASGLQNAYVVVVQHSPQKAMVAMHVVFSSLERAQEYIVRGGKWKKVSDNVWESEGAPYTIKIGPVPIDPGPDHDVLKGSEVFPLPLPVILGHPAPENPA
jgi:hypothetical protein